MIKIGLSACFLYPDITRPVFGHKSLSYMENDMADYLTRDKVMPILIPDIEHTLQKQYLDMADAFVLQGGSDISSLSYNEDPIENGKWPGDKHRDEYELKIIDYAIKNNKPIFGICRGFQLLNVYFGGSLFQDLNLQNKTIEKHRDAEIYDSLHHKVEVIGNGFLSKSYNNAQEISVNTIHHQGINRFAAGLVIEAISVKDGIIEAFSREVSGEPFIMAVQWHPEFSYKLSHCTENGDNLFDYFLKKIGEK